MKKIDLIFQDIKLKKNPHLNCIAAKSKMTEIFHSKAKIYKNYATHLVQSVCYTHIFHGNSCPSYVRKSYRGTRGSIDFEREYGRRIFFTCDGIDYTIRLWSITESPSGNGRTKTEYSTHEWYRCNDCDEEFARDIPNGWTRCDECAKHYKEEKTED